MPGISPASVRAPAGEYIDSVSEGGSVTKGWVPYAKLIGGGTGTAANQVQGTAAESTADNSDNPVKIGARASAGQMNYNEGDRAQVALNRRGELQVFPKANLFSGADALPNNRLMSPEQSGTPQGSTIQFMQFVAGAVFNGSTWDRQRGDTTGTYTVPTPTSAAANAIVPVTSTSSASLLVKGSAGNFYGASVVNNAASSVAGYLIAYNAATLPAAGGSLTAASILAVADVAAGARGSIDPTSVPDRFGTGIVVLFSTSLTTFTAPSVLPVFLKGRGV